MTPRETRSALVIFALLLPSLAGLYWAGSQASAAARPGAMRSFGAGDGERVAVFFGGAMHVLDAAGQRLVRQPLRELGLGEEPNDVDVTTSPEGRVQAWMFDDSGPHLVRCDFDASSSRFAACTRAISGPQLKINPRSQAVHIAVDLPRQRVFVADAKAHAVRALTLQGQVLADGARGELFFPNRLRVVGDRLVVADNDHHRLAWLDIAGERPGFAVRQTLNVRTHPEARGAGKAADFAIATAPDGKLSALWLLAVGQGQKNGQLLVFGPGPSPRSAADLGGHADPLVIDRLGDALLVADFDGVDLYRVGADGRYLGAFGGGDFAADLAAARQGIARAEWTRRAAFAGLGLTLVVGLLLAWRFSERPGAQAAREAFGDLDAAVAETPEKPVELQPAAEFQRHVMWLNAAVFSALVAGCGVLYLKFPHEFPPKLVNSGLMWACAALLAMSLPLSIWVLHRMARRSLWIGEGRVEVRLGPQVLARSPLQQVRASPRALLVGRILLPYRRNTAGGGVGAWIYDRERIRALLVSLAPTQRVTDDQLVRAQVQRTPPWLLALVLVPVLAFVVYNLWGVLR